MEHLLWALLCLSTTQQLGAAPVFPELLRSQRLH
jgi:hypothetical protein